MVSSVIYILDELAKCKQTESGLDMCHFQHRVPRKTWVRVYREKFNIGFFAKLSGRRQNVFYPLVTRVSMTI